MKRGAFIWTLFQGHGKHDPITLLFSDMGQIILSYNIQRVIRGWALPFQHFSHLMWESCASWAWSKSHGIFLSVATASNEMKTNFKCYVVYLTGETVMIVAKINNSSTSDMSPKFSFIQDVVYRASGSTKHESHVIHKVVDSGIRAQTQKEVKCAVTIPPGQMQSIQNCDIITVEYQFKVCHVFTVNPIVYLLLRYFKGIFF